jgi:PPOX class probable F420-dependent enzyme
VSTLDPADPAVRAFWAERHLCTFTTLRGDGSPHVVAIGATFDPDTMTARLISSGGSVKVRNLESSSGPARVAICQVDGRRWSTLEGVARVSRDPADVADSVRRYGERYRAPRENPTRVTILVDVTRVIGRA